MINLYLARVPSRVFGGLGGAAYVWVHRQYVLFMRSNKKMNKFLQKK